MKQNWISWVIANEKESAQLENWGLCLWNVNSECIANRGADVSLLEKKHQWGWESRLSFAVLYARCALLESRSSGLECKVSGKFHLKSPFWNLTKYLHKNICGAPYSMGIPTPCHGDSHRHPMGYPVGKTGAPAVFKFMNCCWRSGLQAC